MFWESMKPEITFERFLEVLVPGAILTVGTWYFHRPFLMVFFPAIASDTAILGVTGGTLGSKAGLFLIASVCVGVIVNCMADVAVVCTVRDASQSDKATRRIRSIVRLFAWPFILVPSRDPRVHVIGRYMSSSRRAAFLRMVRAWTGCDETALANADGIILAHQHIITHLKVVSSDIRAVLSDIYQPVRIASAVFIASALLVPVGLLSFLSASFVQARVAVHPWPILMILTIAAYAFALVSGYSLRRHFRHFCSQSVTLALHQFMIGETMNETKANKTINCAEE